MITKIHDFFTKNIWWKALSLCIAIVLWFVAIYIQNPTETRTFREPLTIINKKAILANNYILVNQEELESRIVDILIKGTHSDLHELERYKSDISVFIDLEPIDISQTNELGTPKDVRVDYKLPSYLDESNYEVLNVSPKTVEIVLDKYSNRAFPVSVEVEGNPQDGYVSYPATSNPENIKVGGARTDIESIDKVQAKVDVGGMNSEVVITTVPVVIDKNGKDITSKMNLNISVVEIIVPIEKYGKIQIAEPTTVENVADGYQISSIVFTPKEIEVVGNQDDVDNIRESGGIKLPPINVSNRTETFSETIELSTFLNGTSLSIRSGSTTKAIVTVNIEKEGIKQIDIPVGNLKIIGADKPYDIKDDHLTLSVKGYQDDFNKLTPDNVKGSVDLTGFDTGTYEMQVKFELPEGIVQIGDIPYVEVVISEGTLPSAQSLLQTESLPAATDESESEGNQTETQITPSVAKQPIDTKKP